MGGADRVGHQESGNTPAYIRAQRGRAFLEARFFVEFMIFLEYSVIQKSALIFQIYSPLQDLTTNIVDPLLLP